MIFSIDNDFIFISTREKSGGRIIWTLKEGESGRERLLNFVHSTKSQQNVDNNNNFIYSLIFFTKGKISNTCK